MFQVRNNQIFLTRGDSATIKLDITGSAGGAYVPADGDVITFTMKRTTNNKNALIQKTFENGEISIEPEDTKDLPYGDYLFDVELRNDGVVATIVPPNLFRICEEVTF